MATRGVCVLAGRMSDTVEIATAADAAGYDAAWTSEFNDRSAIVAMAAMAHNTTRCRIYTAGVNRRMIETAGRVSDGLVCHPTFSSRYVREVVRPAIAKGAERTDRDPAAVEIVG